MKLSVVIVNYNVKRFTEQCLRSVLRAAEGIETEIFVVDNASADNSVKFLSERFPSVTFFSNPHNVGFARANNQAIRLARGEYVLLLNPDTLLAEDTLTTCINFLDTHSEAGGAGVKMLKSNGDFALESRRGMPTPFTAFCKMTGLCQLFPKSHLFGRYYMRYLDENQPNEIDVISGAFACLRRSALNKIGLLDEDFFMYGEDIDLSFRLLKSGCYNFYLPTPIVHYKGESTEKSSFRYVHVFYHAMLIFFNKHYGHYRFWLSLPIRAAIIFRAGLAFLKQQTDKVRRRLGLDNEVDTPRRYLLVGRRQMLDEASALLRQNDQFFECMEADENRLPQGHLATKKTLADFYAVVYDVDAFRYATIFDIMQRSFAQGTPLQLGTYSVQTKALVTHKTVWE